MYVNRNFYFWYRWINCVVMWLDLSDIPLGSVATAPLALYLLFSLGLSGRPDPLTQHIFLLFQTHNSMQIIANPLLRNSRDDVNGKWNYRNVPIKSALPNRSAHPPLPCTPTHPPLPCTATHPPLHCTPTHPPLPCTTTRIRHPQMSPPPPNEYAHCHGIVAPPQNRSAGRL